MAALKSLAGEYAGAGNREQVNMAAMPVPIQRLNPWRRWLPVETVPLEQAAGCIAAETAAFYPPGIPLLCPGEDHPGGFPISGIIRQWGWCVFPGLPTAACTGLGFVKDIRLMAKGKLITIEAGMVPARLRRPEALYDRLRAEGYDAVKVGNILIISRIPPLWSGCIWEEPSAARQRMSVPMERLRFLQLTVMLPIC